jgi:sec-independent protein translocase protein TatA
MDIGPPELLIVLVIVLFLFGSKKLPELARSVGQAKRAFTEGHETPAAEAEDKAEAQTESSPPSSPSGGSTTT